MVILLVLSFLDPAWLQATLHLAKDHVLTFQPVVLKVQMKRLRAQSYQGQDTKASSLNKAHIRKFLLGNGLAAKVIII